MMTKKNLSTGHSFMTRQYFCRWGIVLGACFWGLLFLTSVFANDENVTEYRIMKTPEEKIDIAPFSSRSLPVNRQKFESDLARLEQQSEEQESKQPYLSRILLKAKLDGRQWVSGQGFFTLHPHSDRTDSIPLNPLTLAVNSLRWSDDTDAILFCEPNGGNRLLVPSETDSNSYDQLQFRWSLQSRKDVRNGIVFDVTLPPCLSIELQLDIPDTMVLTASTGLVFPDERGESVGTDNTKSTLRTWRVLLGHHSNTTLTLTPCKTLPSIKQKPTIRQVTNHIIRPEGLETQARVLFDKADPRPTELLLELEKPLRPVEVRYGDRPVVWSKSLISPDVTEIRVDLSPFADEDPQELMIWSQSPLQENRRWGLPCVRVTSSDIFWSETRCGVSVYPPLRTRNLVYHQAVQVPPVAAFDWAVRELYVFQFFQEDAQIELEIVHTIPHVTVNSATQLHLSDNEIQGTVYLDCNISEGERFALHFPVSEHWIIDSVTSYLPTGTIPTESDVSFSRDVLLDAQSQTLSVQLNRPLRPRQPIALQMTCRFINSAQTQFRLADLSPLVLAHRHGESHFIATHLDLTARQLKPSTDASAFNVPLPIIIGGNVLGVTGSVYPLDSQTQDIRFELELMRPNYTAEISGSIYMDHNGLSPTFSIRCTPIDSSISRVFVYFTPSGASMPDEENIPRQWDWLLSDDPNLSRLFRVSRSSAAELRELVPASEQQNWNENWERGEIWEIRFDELQTEPFELSACSSIPFSDSITMPLASVPLASSQKGELTIESPQHFDYRIVGTRLDSIPIAPAAWDHYPSIRAAFRYDPHEELRRSQHAPLMLQKLTPEEQIVTAWVWSLRLDSRYAPEGTVQNRALFLVENQGQDTLQITLPHGINADNVFAVWRDSRQIPWQCNEGQKTIDVALPTGQRFVTIALEYVYQDLPLVQQRKLRPRCPTTDIPVLSGSWISWFPSEFDVSLRHAVDNATTQSVNNTSLSKALDYLLSRTYRSFLGSIWNDVLYGEQWRMEAETAAEYFFAEVAASFQNNSGTTLPATTWGELIGNERILSSVRDRLANENTKRTVEARLLIDKQALSFLRITPATPIEALGTILKGNVREELFENTGLMLLIATRNIGGSQEYVFALTTPTMLSLHRQFQPIPAGHCVRAVPFEIFDSASQSSQWIPSSRWLSETMLSSIPWSISSQVMQRTAFTSDWNAYELPLNTEQLNTEQPLYIVHRQKFAALQWIAFLSIVLITCRKPFSSPLVLLALLILFELTARSVAPCYIGIPSGAFLGVLVSFAFVLIRSQLNPHDPLPESPSRHDSTECSVSFVPTPLSLRSVMICGLLTVIAGLPVFASAQTLSEPIQNSSRKEPYRIFYPTDSEGQQVVGQNVWVPVEFLNLLHQKLNRDDPAVVPRWNLIQAAYQGSLIRGSSGHLECSDDFKVVYTIYLDSPSTTITLPNLPAVQGKIYWNTRPIQPIWSGDTRSDLLSFAIENETPGIHTLEMALSPKVVLQNDGETFQIAFAIPKVPHATLRLNVPPGIPPISVPDALGAVTANTSLLPVLTAELGPVQQLSLAWVDDPSRNETSASEVEQFFRMRVKPLRIELEALFRFRINNGNIRHLTIQTDPRWSLSGQFQCIEGYPITQRLETTADTQLFDELTALPYNVSRIDFQSPVSETVTLRANFIFTPWPDPVRPNQEFYGIGNLRLPEFKVLELPILKSMLAVYADHPSLELHFPTEGRSNGFESGWKGTSPVVMPPLFRDVPFLDIASSLLTSQDDTTPDAEYDLTRTELDWTLNVRTKKVVPDVAVSQFVQLDTGESKVQIVGTFTADSDVFRQYFTACHPMQIEAVEVLDSQNTAVESRFERIAPETLPEHYLVFLKRPVTGTYTMTVRGVFVTDTNAELPLQSVPALVFNDVKTTEHSFRVFRTPAVIAEIPPEQNSWSKSSTVPSTPEWFSQSIPLGIWRRTDTAESVSPEPELDPLQFALSPNRPKVKCKTVLSLHADSDDQWTMTLDLTGSVTNGELKTLRFQWDERCGSIQSIEPSASVSFTPSDGQQTLALLLHEPIRDEQHIKIVVSLNKSGPTSLPNVFPLADGADQFESELFVELPRQPGNENIRWDLNQLVEEEQTADTKRLVFRALDNNFSAVINQDEAQLTAVFYDIGFLIKHDGEIFGITTIDLRNRGQDHFVLQMPSGYVPIQISSAGLMLEHTRLPASNRWRINIGTSDYPQRFCVLFRAALPQPLKQWNREQIISTLQFPILEGIAVQETIWMAAFEGNLPPLNVTLLRDRHWGAGATVPSDSLGSEEYELGEYLPISGMDAKLSFIGLNLIRKHNLIQVLKSLPVSSRQEEMRRWFLHWSAEWNIVADKVDFQVSHLPLTSHNVRPRLITRSVDSTSEEAEASGIIRPFLELMGAKTQEALKDTKEQAVLEKFGSAMGTVSKQPTPILNSQVYWQGRMSEEVQCLFGTEEGALGAIHLKSVPNTSGWLLQLSEHTWLWISFALLIPIFVLLSVRWVYLSELWLQFPHFWGMTLGILIWVFMPESFLGPIIIVLTFLSFFRPSWTHHRFRVYS